MAPRKAVGRMSEMAELRTLTAAARLRRLCRRVASGLPPVLRCGDLDVDSGRHEVRRAGVLLTLTGKEFFVTLSPASAARRPIRAAQRGCGIRSSTPRGTSWMS